MATKSNKNTTLKGRTHDKTMSTRKSNAKQPKTSSTRRSSSPVSAIAKKTVQVTQKHIDKSQKEKTTKSYKVSLKNRKSDNAFPLRGGLLIVFIMWLALMLVFGIFKKGEEPASSDKEISDTQDLSLPDSLFASSVKSEEDEGDSPYAAWEEAFIHEEPLDEQVLDDKPIAKLVVSSDKSKQEAQKPQQVLPKPSPKEEPKTEPIKPIAKPDETQTPMAESIETSSLPVSKPASSLPDIPDIQKPVVSEEELPRWKKNAIKVYELPKTASVVAIIIDDLGISKKITRSFAELPAPLTMAFITYAEDLPEQIEYAQMHDKEIMLHLPMEPSNSSVNSGPNTFTSTMSAKEITENVKRTITDELLKFNIAGVNNHMGSKFTADKQAIEHFMDTFAPLGLYFIDSVTTRDSVAMSEAEKRGIPTASRNVFIDNEQDVQYILGQLRALEKSALKHGKAIGIGHPHAATLSALKIWLPEIEDKGLYLTPASFIVEERSKSKH